MALSGTPVARASVFYTDIYPPLPNSDVESGDVQDAEERLGNSDQWLHDSLVADAFTPYSATFTSTFPASISSVSSATFTDTAVIFDIPAAQALDGIRINVSGTWLLTGQTASTVCGELRFAVVEDFGGAASVVVPSGYATIVEQVAASNTIQSYSLYAHHIVTTAGPVRVKVQIRYFDLAGGADTATIALLLIARLDAELVRRS